jgi:hypothetical protein
MSDWVCKNNAGKRKETTSLIKQNTSVVISRVHVERIKMAKLFSIEKFLCFSNERISKQRQSMGPKSRPFVTDINLSSF